MKESYLLLELSQNGLFDSFLELPLLSFSQNGLFSFFCRGIQRGPRLGWAADELRDFLELNNFIGFLHFEKRKSFGKY